MNPSNQHSSEVSFLILFRVKFLDSFLLPREYCRPVHKNRSIQTNITQILKINCQWVQCPCISAGIHQLWLLQSFSNKNIQIQAADKNRGKLKALTLNVFDRFGGSMMSNGFQFKRCLKWPSLLSVQSINDFPVFVHFFRKYLDQFLQLPVWFFSSALKWVLKAHGIQCIPKDHHKKWSQGVTCDKRAGHEMGAALHMQDLGYFWLRYWWTRAERSKGAPSCLKIVCSRFSRSFENKWYRGSQLYISPATLSFTKN